MMLVDTNFRVALARPRDELHDRAAAWSKAVRTQMLVTELVIWEFLNQLSAPAERGKAAAMVAEMQTHKGYRLVYASRGLFSQGLDLYSHRRDKHWSLTDCVSFVLMTKHSIRAALTFDHHFEEAGFEALLRADPPSSISTS